jgi:hypothetical protein
MGSSPPRFPICSVGPRPRLIPRRLTVDAYPYRGSFYPQFTRDGRSFESLIGKRTGPHHSSLHTPLRTAKGVDYRLQRMQSGAAPWTINSRRRYRWKLRLVTLLNFRGCPHPSERMAEREGFEPPIALRLCLISSQVHSTGLCHLSALQTTTYRPWLTLSDCRSQSLVNHSQRSLHENRSRRLQFDLHQTSDEHIAWSYGPSSDPQSG